MRRTPILFMVTPCINNAEPFYYQLMHIMLKNTELLKHSKISVILECFNNSVFFNIMCISW